MSDMTQSSTSPNTNQFAAAVIESGLNALAAYATTELLEARPNLIEQFGNNARELWQQNLTARLEELCAALTVRQPEIFAHDLAWAKASFRLRDLDLEDLRESNRALLRVIDQELPRKVHAEVKPYFEMADDELLGDNVRVIEHLDAETPHGKLSARYLLAILEGNRREASELVLNAVRDGLAVRDAYLDVLIPASREVGRMWHAGELNIAEEHFATATTEMVMCQMFPYFPEVERHHKTVICAAAQGNLHGLAVRVISDFFEMDGWRVIHLGANMPARDLAQAAVDFKADLLAISITMSRHLRNTSEIVRQVRERLPERKVPILVGGLAMTVADDIWQKLGADASATTATEAVHVGRRLVGLSDAD